MGIFSSKTKEGNVCCNFMFCDGTDAIAKGSAVEVSLEDEALSIRNRLGKNPPIKLNYEQICNFAVVDEKEIEETDKSVIGRAIVGGVILGPLGGVVGGMSGMGKKKKAAYKKYLIINYHPINEPDEVNAISFEIVGATLHLGKITKGLADRVKVEQPKPITQL